MISSLPSDHSNIPNCHRQNLSKGRPKLPKSKADKGDAALRTSALRELKVKSLANPGIQPDTHAQPQFPAALRVSVGQRGTRGLLGRWRGWAWWLPRLGILAGGGAGWPFPSAFTVASVRYLHGSPSMRPGGAQVSVGKTGVGRVLSNIPGFVRSRTVCFWRPIQKCSSPILSTPVLGVFDNSGKGREESSAAAPGYPGQPQPLLAFCALYSLSILLSACLLCIELNKKKLISIFNAFDY